MINIFLYIRRSVVLASCSLPSTNPSSLSSSFSLSSLGNILFPNLSNLKLKS